MKNKKYYIIGGIIVSGLFAYWYCKKNNTLPSVFSKDKSSITKFPIEEEEILKPETTFEK
jgi:hypothetical protein